MERSHLSHIIVNKMLLFVLWYFVTILCSYWCCVGSSNFHCKEIEKKALLEFKHSLTDPSHRLSSWEGEDCCNWMGIHCDNRTGHVVKLDLRNPNPFNETRWRRNNDHDPIYAKSCLVGKEVNHSLLHLKHLKYLDLSWNNFSGIRIPHFFGSFEGLRYINLSYAVFGGVVPYQLGNLSTLQYLDLSTSSVMFEDIYVYPQLSVDNLHWMSHLSNLEYLGMSSVNLSWASNSVQAIGFLPHLFQLHLSHCSLGPGPLPYFIYNMTSLEVLDLSLNRFNTSIENDYLSQLCNLETLDFSSNDLYGDIHKLFRNSSLSRCSQNHDKLETLELSENYLSGYIPNWVGELQNLKTLSLSYNGLSGSIPYSIGKLSSLRSLFLYENYDMNGTIPSSIGKLRSLRNLDVSSCQLHGTIPESLGQLSHLEMLDLSNNFLQGDLSEVHFSHLSNLKILDLSSNSLTLKAKSDWLPPFQLQYIFLRSCKLGPQFPMWLQTQQVFISLDISNASIIDSVPEWLFNISSRDSSLSIDLSSNKFHGVVPKIFMSRDVQSFVLFLHDNMFGGPLPQFPSNAKTIDVSHNLFSGSIPEDIGTFAPNMTILALSNNSLNGTIPRSLCKMKHLWLLELSMNNISGGLPQCWDDLKDLVVLDLSSNNITGMLPSSIGALINLESLHLSENKLHGQIPLSLKNCSSLVTLDLRDNRFTGKFPAWIGEYLSSLQILNLRLNKFNGIIPSQLCRMTDLRFLDLAHNNLHGTIPRCVGNLTAMVMGAEAIFSGITDGAGDYTENIKATIKGAELAYTNSLSYLYGLDLSGNNLVGGIPEEMMKLYALETLNLSNNRLSGNLHEKIGDMWKLESLDLSGNQLNGTIPQGFLNLTLLAHLNLSFNRFSGKIPYGGQLQTFEPSSFIGNVQLCGDPLEKCQGSESSLPPIDMPKYKRSESEMMNSFYIGFASGHIIGFGGVCCILVFSKTWGVAYFQFLSNMQDKLVLMVALNVARLKRMKNTCM